MIFKVHSTGRRDEDAIGTCFHKNFRIRIVEADDVTSECRGRVH
jgi:hypothetical protein